MFYTACKETFDLIDAFDTYWEAAEAICNYESDDMLNGDYSEDFYIILDEDHNPVEFENRSCTIKGTEINVGDYVAVKLYPDNPRYRNDPELVYSGAFWCGYIDDVQSDHIVLNRVNVNLDNIFKIKVSSPADMFGHAYYDDQDKKFWSEYINVNGDLYKRV